MHVSVCICLFINAGCVRPCVCISALIPVSECVCKHIDLEGVCMSVCLWICLSQCSDLYKIAALAGRSWRPSIPKTKAPDFAHYPSLRVLSLTNSQRAKYLLPINCVQIWTLMHSKCPYVLGPQHQHVLLLGPGLLFPQQQGSEQYHTLGTRD